MFGGMFSVDATGLRNDLVQVATLSGAHSCELSLRRERRRFSHCPIENLAPASLRIHSRPKILWTRQRKLIQFLGDCFEPHLGRDQGSGTASRNRRDARWPGASAEIGPDVARI